MFFNIVLTVTLSKPAASLCAATGVDADELYEVLMACCVIIYVFVLLPGVYGFAWYTWHHVSSIVNMFEKQENKEKDDERQEEMLLIQPLKQPVTNVTRY